MTEKKEKTCAVAGEMRVQWHAELPESKKNEAVSCDDPAIEVALLAGTSGPIEIFLWGEDEPPARVWLDVYEDDIDLEEDER